MTKVKAGALTLNVVTEGPREAPAVILAHPLGADLSVWDDVAPNLAKKFFVVRFDARGHGGSDVPPGPYALADLGGDVVALMDALGLARAHFIGLSMSGAVGQWLIIHAPGRLDKIVLANTAAHFPGPEGWNARIRAARGGKMADLAAMVVQRWLTPAFRAENPEKYDQVEGLLRASPPLGYAACCAALRDADLRELDPHGAAASGPGDRRRIRRLDAARARRGLGRRPAPRPAPGAARASAGRASLLRRVGRGFSGGSGEIPGLGFQLAQKSARRRRRGDQTIGVDLAERAGAGGMFIMVGGDGDGVGADGAGRAFELVGEIGRGRARVRDFQLVRDLGRLPVEQGEQFAFQFAVAHGLAGEMDEIDGRVGARRSAGKGRAVERTMCGEIHFNPNWRGGGASRGFFRRARPRSKAVACANPHLSVATSLARPYSWKPYFSGPSGFFSKYG